MGKIFLFCFWKKSCSPRLHLFVQKYSKNSDIMKEYYNLFISIFYFNIFKM